MVSEGYLFDAAIFVNYSGDINGNESWVLLSADKDNIEQQVFHFKEGAPKIAKTRYANGLRCLLRKQL